MINDTLKKIENKSFIESNEIILDICKKKVELSLEEIEFIFNLPEKELVNTFFYEYALFNQKDFLFIENLINLNLQNTNKDFVSDLIYVALDFGLDLNYRKLLSLLIIEEEDKDLLVLACLEYIHKNIKFIYFQELINSLEYVRNNTIYYQNEQLLSSLILYRITHKKKYLSFVEELIASDHSNFKFLGNILKGEMYDDNFFDLSEIKKIIGGFV